MTLTLRPYQQEGLNALWSYFQDGSTGNPLLCWPTGTGKSIVPAIFIESIMRLWPTQRFLLLTSVSELIKQNAEILKEVWPEAPLGIYSAGLKQKQAAFPIVYGGIQSAKNQPHLFSHRDLIFIDECFSKDTEILTETGFVRFDELGDQEVGQFNSETKFISFIKPIRKVKKYPSSKMIHVSSEKSFDLMLTENHEILFKGLNKKYQKCKAKDIVKANYIKIPVAGLGCGIDNELTVNEKLIICFQADGNLHKINNDGSAILAFSFSKQRKIDKFLELMNEIGLPWNEVSSNPTKDKVKERRRFMVYVNRPISKDVHSYFNLKELSAAKARSIIEYMNHWDGHVATKNTYLYTNTNKKAADFYQAVATLAGHRSNLTMVIDDRSEKFSDCYHLFITIDKNEISTQSWDYKEIEYEDEVYCVEVPDGNIIVRRNGKVIVTGNCHLINQDDASMYLSFLSTMKLINPHLKIIGMTATPFRMGQGYITDGGIFTDIVHDLCSMENFNKLIDDGYLAPLVPLRTRVELDVSNVGMAKGEFIQSQLQHAVDVAEVTYEGLRELVEAAHDRRSWLIFASGVEHSEHIAQMLGSFGIDCAAVHSKQTDEYNAKAIEAFKTYNLRALVNYGKLTTGFNHPGVDAIAVFRPTMSVPLWIQLLGRGTRPAPGKKDCLVLDYARNTPRLGCVNDPVIPRRKGEKGGDPPVKVCNTCGVFNHIKNKTCTTCGEEFSFEIKITKTAGSHELIKSDLPIIETFNVDRVIYNKHQKLDKAPCLKITYFTGIRSFTEWLFPQSMKGPGRHYFHTWWRNRTDVPPPATVDEALLYTQGIRVPKNIRVWVNKKIPEIMGSEF